MKELKETELITSDCENLLSQENEKLHILK